MEVPRKAKQVGNEHVLVFQPGETVLETLHTYLTQRHITSAKFVAVGGFSRVQLEYTDVQSKQYEPRAVNEQVEVINLLGNVALEDGNPFAQACVAVGTKDCHVRAGHLGEATVRPTLELFLTQLNGDLTREKNPSTGLEALQP